MATLIQRFDTLRRMGAGQLACRLRRRLRQRFVYPRRAAELFPWPGPLAEREEAVPFDERRVAALRPRAELLAQADALVERRFAYLSLEPQELGEPADWQRAPLQDPLWQYNLHYGEWAVDLTHAFLLTDERRYRATCIELVEDWLEGNPVSQRPAWDPYPICRRVVAWSRIAGALASSSSIGRRFFRRRMEPSLRQQAAFLAANLEYDVPNNHLIANFKALAWLGLLFPAWPEATTWQEQGLQGLWKEMRRQVLADGVHEERSLSYHCVVLQDLLEVRWLAERQGVEVPPDVDPTLGRMLAVLEITRTPGDLWPMTGDTVHGYPMDPRSLHRAASTVLPGVEAMAGSVGDDAWYVSWLGGEVDANPPAAGPSADEATLEPSCQLLPQAGWAILRQAEGGYVFFDAGALGPDKILGHAHADVLSFELHGAGRPLLVDPGVCTYRSGSLRDRFRSTAVHNTVSVDGADQCVFWGPFRVAHPPKTGLLVDDDGLSVTGWHDGYRRLRQPIVHRRRIAWRDGGWEVKDRLEGKGHHLFSAGLQLAPGAVASVHGARGEALWADGTALHLRILGEPEAMTLEVVPGEVSPSWNTILSAPRWVVRWQAEAPTELTFRLTVHHPGMPDEELARG